MRIWSIGLAVAALLFATVALVREFAFPNNERIERVTCLAGICASDELAARAYGTILAGAPDTPATVERLRTLVARNPASPHPWASLAEALAETGDRAGAQSAMLQAIQRGPAIPQVCIRAANLFAELGDPAAAARSLAAALQATAAFDEVVFDSFRRLQLRTSEVLPLVLAHRRSSRAYFYDVRHHGTPKDLALVWDCLLAAGHADKDLAASYLGAVSVTPLRRQN